MSIKLIPLSHLEADPWGMLNECLESGQSLVVELPDHRLVSIQGLEPGEDDDLIDRPRPAVCSQRLGPFRGSADPGR